MLSVLYEDKDIIVVNKPAGLESQTARGFAPDMVSEIRKYLSQSPDIHKLATSRCTKPTQPQPPYVGVIHRLDKPVSGIMVYAKNQKAANALSTGLQTGNMKKEYRAVVCGKPVDNQGTYVDYLRQDKKNNRSEIVDKSVEDSKRAELNYRVLGTVKRIESGEEREYSLVEIELLTGRHHQIRVQFAGHGTPLFGDGRYGTGGAGQTVGAAGSAEAAGSTARSAGATGSAEAAGGTAQTAGAAKSATENAASTMARRIHQVTENRLALCAFRLAFSHPSTGKPMSFKLAPQGGAFAWFTAAAPIPGSPKPL